MMECGRCDDEIWLRKGMSGFAAFFDQQPPFEHHVFRDLEHALCEHWPHRMREPMIEFGPSVSVFDEFDAESNLGKGHAADVEAFERLCSNKGDDFTCRLG